MKYVPTANKRGRPRATEVIAKTNHKVEDFFRKKQTQVDRPMEEPEEEKKQEVPREEAVEFIDTSSNPQPSSVQQPAEVRATGLRKILTAEESKTEAIMTAKVDNPEARRIQMVEQMRKSKRREILSKKRQAHQDSSLVFEPEEQLDPFAGPMISDFDHCWDFFAANPEVTEEQYLDLFEGARRRHPGQQEEFYQE